MLEDLATLTGGRAMTEDLGLALKKVTLEDLGRARVVTIDKDPGSTSRRPRPLRSPLAPTPGSARAGTLDIGLCSASRRAWTHKDAA